MSTDGILEYQGTKRVLYRGDTSNIVFDTRTTSLGIGVTGSNNPSSNLYITGNAYVSSNLAIGGVMTMGVVNVAARHNLQAVTDMGNVTTHTVEFTNPTTSFVCTGSGGVVLPTGTTAQQPTGVMGMVRFNTTTNRMEFYSGTEWRSLGGVSATGGSVTTFGGYRIHTFTSDGTFTPNVSGTVEYLIVGGGGGGGVSGGSGGGGGGGAGGVLHGNFMVVGGTAYDVDVGLGGSGVSNTISHVQGGKGQNSSIFGLIAYGGGGGTGGTGSTGYSSQTNSNGGSGSGQGSTSSVLNPAGPGIGTAGSRPQGTNGGYASTTGNSAGGGGGGAGTAGGDGSDTLGGFGGDGIEWPPGSGDYYAGGGAGSTTNSTTISQGGNGGGGNTFADGTDGMGGGGGGGHNGTTDSGAGGSGIVIIRYLS
jgi:hypothetical protein